MRLDHIGGLALDRLFGRFLRRSLAVLVAAAFAIVAILYFTVAALLVLEAHYGAMQAHLAIGAAYAAATTVTLIALWATRNGKTSSGETLTTPREMQLAMLVEAIMLGYALSRKREPLP